MNNENMVKHNKNIPTLVLGIAIGASAIAGFNKIGDMLDKSNNKEIIKEEIKDGLLVDGQNWNGSKLIELEKAEEIAMKRCGTESYVLSSESDVFNLGTRPKYYIKLQQGFKRYTVTVDAITGEVLNFN